MVYSIRQPAHGIMGFGWPPSVSGSLCFLPNVKARIVQILVLHVIAVTQAKTEKGRLYLCKQARLCNQAFYSFWLIPGCA